MTWILWLESVHVFFVIAWMAGLLYLPRLFAYHADAETGSVQSETFKTMERRLLRGIMNPAMVLVWISGPWLAWETLAYTQPWFHVKLAAVVVLTVLHHFYAAWRKAFAEDRNTRPARFYKFWNEAPAVLLAIIIVMVIVKPFQ